MKDFNCAFVLSVINVQYYIMLRNVTVCEMQEK